MSRPRRFRDLPLFWKFLLPSLALLVVVGAVGTFVVVRNLSERAQVSLDQRHAGWVLDARIELKDRELSLLEAVNFASNLRGMDEAIRSGRASSAETLLRSVLALKRSLSLLVVTDPKGRGLVELMNTGAPAPRRSAGREWSRQEFVSSVTGSKTGERTAGFLQVEGRTLLAIAGPVCTDATSCRPAGAAIGAVDVNALVGEARVRLESQRPAGESSPGVSLFGTDGRLLARTGTTARETLPPIAAQETERTIDGNFQTLFSPFEVQGRRAGTLAVTVSRSSAFAAVRGTGVRLALIILAALAGLVGLMALLSRRILVQVRPLVAASRAFGGGDLAARVPVKSRDELGELALGVNKMAEQLQGSYETLETRVAERTEEVRQLLEQRNEFFTSLSHEFRTPLAVILSEAQMLEDSDQPRNRGVGEALRLSSEQLLRAINEILQLAESDAGTIDIQLERLDLKAVMKEIRPAIDRLTGDAGLRVTVKMPRTLSPVVADPARLREVILNLVDNAVKYTPSGGSVALTAASNNGSVVISVADTGVGIPPEVGERVFEPFYRVAGTRPTRGQASSGLGLALTKRFVEAQGGSITFEPRSEGGTVFSVSIPAARSPGDLAQ